MTDNFVQLTPALLQPGRLDFDLISATDDHAAGLSRMPIRSPDGCSSFTSTGR